MLRRMKPPLSNSNEISIFTLKTILLRLKFSLPCDLRRPKFQVLRNPGGALNRNTDWGVGGLGAAAMAAFCQMENEREREQQAGVMPFLRALLGRTPNSLGLAPIFRGRFCHESLCCAAVDL